jgi:hypothetical protein
MSEWFPYCEGIDLFVKKRISKDDAERQQQTARTILSRLAHQPGLVLADEVGMGKTFVALAVAASVAVETKSRRPVVVMVPPSLKEKWPQDFKTFREKCCVSTEAKSVCASPADSAVHFLRLLEAPAEKQCSIIFLTHGAMHGGLSDGWTKLAIIQRALRGRHHTERLGAALSRSAGQLLRLGWVSRNPNIWDRLLDHPSEEWAKILDKHGVPLMRSDVDAVSGSRLMAVPKSVARALLKLSSSNFSDVYDALRDIPKNQSPNYAARIAEARRALTQSTKSVWKECVVGLHLHLPLLILDEAHHLKNPTKLSGLFQVPEAQEDAEVISKGIFGRVFERMLFLTATPFQLGHHELCSVLNRFSGIRWDSHRCELQSRERFTGELKNLEAKLDEAQLEARDFDRAWGHMRAEDFQIDGIALDDPQQWWSSIRNDSKGTDSGQQVYKIWQEVYRKMRDAESALRPWVIRHLKPDRFEGRLRRKRLLGDAIITGADNTDKGIEISDRQLLPFLLAARAAFSSPQSRPVFAEGLASSFEAFLETRHPQKDNADTGLTDGDDDPIDLEAMSDKAGEMSDKAGEWYLEQLEASLPKGKGSPVLHPKVHATAKRVMDEWRRGEKVLIFCHYIRTGHVLQRVISEWMRKEIHDLGAKKLGCKPEQVEGRLELIGRRFFDKDSPVSRACNEEVSLLLDN